MKDFIKKILVSFGYRSLGLDHNNEHSKWAKPIGHCILIAHILDEKQIELRSIFRKASTNELCGWATRTFAIYETELLQRIVGSLSLYNFEKNAINCE